MGIFGRMKTMLKANANDLASKAENPEKVLNQVIRDMESQLSDAKLQVRDTIADQKLLEQRLRATLESAQDWERKAMTAVNAGRDELAREALGRKQEQDELASELQDSVEKQKANAASLKDSLRQLATKVDEAKRKRDLLIARQKRVEANTQISGTMSATTNSSAFDSFERNAEKIENMEAEVAAAAELSDTVRDDDLNQRFGEIEQTHGADDALAALKAKMGKD